MYHLEGLHLPQPKPSQTNPSQKVYLFHTTFPPVTNSHHIPASTPSTPVQTTTQPSFWTKLARICAKIQEESARQERNRPCCCKQGGVTCRAKRPWPSTDKTCYRRIYMPYNRMWVNRVVGKCKCEDEMEGKGGEGK
ncbi:hypothetical protein BJ508DRAFT_329637 [Ascobolus immersus RN42]|uniref:Uncharacterized protein n=1 Tax=Ascobolus immersus RN42 TaxID=1160509 RepID=A0A3N4I1K8_ASCIM|nr:hypothetical protein BJ508DRAFT_329637 [Ascobolus immersus RN42]